MERAEMFPQAPRGRAAMRSDRTQLVADRDDAFLDSRELGGGGPPHDVVLLDRIHQIRGNGPSLVRSYGLRRDLAEQRGDVLRLPVNAAFSGKTGVVGHRASPCSQTILRNLGIVSTL